MNPIELALEQFFNTYRYTPGAFDCLEEGDIFVAQELVEQFISHKRLNTLEATAFLSFLSNMPRIQGIMIFKMGAQKISSTLEEQFAKFKATESSRQHRQVETPVKTLKPKRVFA